MKILMIEPTTYRNGSLVRREMRPTQLISLTLPYLAAVGGAQHDYVLAYDVCEDIEGMFDLAAFDLVAITVQTIHMKRAIEVATAARRAGTRVVVGGPVTVEDSGRLVPVLSRFANSTVVGDGELTWPEVLADAERDALKPLYSSTQPSPTSGWPLPRFDLVNFDLIEQPHVLPALTARGCPRRCTFCSEFLYSPWRLRSTAEIVKELLSFRDTFGIPRIVFRDDDFLVHPQRSKELLSELIGEGIEWACQTDLNLARHPDLLEIALRSGMRAVSFGLESVHEQNRILTEKTFFTIPEAEELLLRLHEAGVETQINIIFGFDHDDKGTFQETLEFLLRTKVSRFFGSILFPISGTPLFEKLKQENRLLYDRPPGIDDPLRVWFEPMRLTAEELVEGYQEVEREFAKAANEEQNFWLGRDMVVI